MASLQQLALLLLAIVHSANAFKYIITPWCDNSFRVTVTPYWDDEGFGSGSPATLGALVETCGATGPAAVLAPGSSATNGSLKIALGDGAGARLTFARADTGALLFDAATAVAPATALPSQQPTGNPYKAWNLTLVNFSQGTFSD